MITSRNNPTVKQVRALRNRKTREVTGLFFAEGIRIVGEAVALNAEVETCVVAPELLSSPYGRELVQLLGRRVPVLDVSGDVFQSLSTKEGPQGIGAVVRQRWHPLDALDPAGDFCWVALESTQDPGNVGTIMRTSDAVGGAGIILLGAGTDPYAPPAVRASMGAVFSQKMIRADFPELLAWSRSHGCMLVATSDAAALDYQDVVYHSPLVLLMGSEREGLQADQRATADVVVGIPMVGSSDSLNLAVATGVVLYEMFNQKRKRV
jgi:TrmH family RNA methyltransferase